MDHNIANQEINDAYAQSAIVATELEQHRKERDELRGGLLVAEWEQNAAIQGRNAAIQEHNATIRDRDTAIQERDAATQRHDAALSAAEEALEREKAALSSMQGIFQSHLTC